MGFVALGGLAAVLVSTDPVSEAWSAGGLRILFALAVGAGIIGVTIIAYRRITAARPRVIAIVTILGLGFFLGIVFALGFSLVSPRYLPLSLYAHPL